MKKGIKCVLSQSTQKKVSLSLLSLALLSYGGYGVNAATTVAGNYIGIGSGTVTPEQDTDSGVIKYSARANAKNVTLTDNANGQGAASAGTLAVGQGAYAGWVYSSAIGTDAFARRYSTTTGAYSVAQNYSTANGLSAYANNEGTAVGNNAQAENGVAIGYKATAGDFYKNAPGETFTSYQGTAIGNNSYAFGGTAIGHSAKANYFGVAIGDHANTGINGTALGDYTSVLKSSGVAIGLNSVANRGAGRMGYIPTETTVPTDELSLARAIGQESVVTNFNSQYGATNTEYNKVMSDFNAAINAKTANDNIIRNTYGSTKAADIAAYNDAKAKKEALDNASVAQTKVKDNWLKSHKDFLTALTNKNNALSTFNATRAAVSVGANVGPNTEILTRQITNVAAGTEDTDVVNVAQLKQVKTYATYKGVNGVTITDNADGTHNVGVNAGTGLSVNNDGQLVTDVTKSDITKLNDAIKNSTTVVKNADDNIVVTKTDGKNEYNIGLAKNISVDSLTTKEITADYGDIKNLTANTVNVGDTTINNNGVSIANGPSITKDGIDAANKTISNVANAVNPGDVVNKGQLDTAVNKLGGDINHLGHEINKVGAGASALAGLHPLDFDPDNKFNVAVAGGFYKDEQALALGAFYRPNEETMFSVASTVGNNNNMVNVGASFKVGQTTTERKFKEQYKTAPISTVYVLENKVNTLEAQHKEDTKTINDLKETIDKLVAKVGL